MDENVCDGRFAVIGRRMPRAPAVLDRGQGFTFGEIDEQSELIARWLSAHGSGPEQALAILVSRNGDLPACALGVWRPRAAYLALDDETPRARLRSIITEIRPVAVLAQRHLHHRLSAALGVDSQYSARAARPTSPALARSARYSSLDTAEGGENNEPYREGRRPSAGRRRAARYSGCLELPVGLQQEDLLLRRAQRWLLLVRRMCLQFRRLFVQVMHGDVVALQVKRMYAMAGARCYRVPAV